MDSVFLAKEIRAKGQLENGHKAKFWTWEEAWSREQKEQLEQGQEDAKGHTRSKRTTKVIPTMGLS